MCGVLDNFDITPCRQWPVKFYCCQTKIGTVHDFGGIHPTGLKSCTKRIHDDIIKWKHFPCYWPFVRGVHLSPVNSPHKGQWRGALMFSLIYDWINGWVNNSEVGYLRRHRVHYDVTVMPQLKLYRQRDIVYSSLQCFLCGGSTILIFLPCRHRAMKFYCYENKYFFGLLFWRYSSYRKELCTKWISSSNCSIRELRFTATSIFCVLCVVAQTIVTFSSVVTELWNFKRGQNNNLSGLFFFVEFILRKRISSRNYVIRELWFTATSMEVCIVTSSD